MTVAATTLSQLAHISPQQTESWHTDMGTPSSPLVDFGDVNSESHPRRTHQAALEFLVAVLLRFTILLRLATDCGPLLHEHRRLLEEQQSAVKMHEIMGCRNWVLVSIIDAIALKSWRSEAQSNRCLSIRELVQRSEAIENNLNHGLQRLEAHPVQSEAVDKVTRIYALAALTYLHTIVDGCNPSLPGIRDSVRKTMALLTARETKSILAHLVWPICITALMADNVEQQTIKDLLSDFGAENQESPLLRALKEMWRQSEQQLEREWTTAVGIACCGTYAV